MRFFIVNSGRLNAVNKRVSDCCNVAPVKIATGTHAGKYAVNVEIFTSDPAFEKVRAVLESCPVATLTAEEISGPAQQDI